MLDQTLTLPEDPEELRSFTARLLALTLREIGFGHVVVARDRPNYALWALATKTVWPDAETKSIVQLDDERKAAMVSNLLVVLCSDRDAQPIVNTGTIYQ